MLTSISFGILYSLRSANLFLGYYYKEYFMLQIEQVIFLFRFENYRLVVLIIEREHSDIAWQTFMLLLSICDRLTEMDK